MKIKTDTSPSDNFQKHDEGTVFKKDKSYDISVIHDEETNEAVIKYSYFGVPFHETVTIN